MAGTIYDEDYIRDSVTITPDGCWNWNKATDINGYGQVNRISSGESLAHRLSYRIFKGSCVGLHVLHRCDNPPCCNPEHLFVGTQRDNIHDMRNKGRGWSHPRKIPGETIVEIRQQHSNGVTRNELMEKYNIKCTTMHNIINKLKAYKHG